MRSILLAALILLSPHARAATATGSFQVQINIEAACTVTGASTLDFGNAGVLASNVDATSTISIQCTASTPYSIGLNAGVTGSGVLSRQMASGANVLNYSLFRDTGRSLNWGETISTDTVAAIGNGAVQSHTVFGRVPAQTTPVPGLYTDTVTVTVTY